MHTLHLGAYPYFLGVLQYLLAYMMPGSAEDNLESVWQDIIQAYENHQPDFHAQVVELPARQVHEIPMPEIQSTGGGSSVEAAPTYVW
jgi:hypothetical protein